MEMIGERSERKSSRGPQLVSFSASPLSFPVNGGMAAGWVLATLLVANLGRIPVLATGSRTAALTINDLAVAGLVAFCIIAAVLKQSLWLDNVSAFALMFAATGFISAVSGIWRLGFTPSEVTIGLTYLARWLMYLGVYVFTINNVQEREVDFLWRALVKVTLIFTAFGIFQSIFLPGFAQIVYPDSVNYVDWDPQGHRLVSTVLEPNIAAAMIVLVLLIQLAQLSFGARIPMWQPLILLAGLAMTLSRSGALALLVGLMVVLFARGISVRLLRMLAAVGFLSLAVLPRLISFAQEYGKFEVGAQTSAGARILSWLTALQAISEHPVIGVGFNTFGYYRERLGGQLSGASSYGADGGLLFATAMTGLVGLCLFLAMFACVVARCRRIWREPAFSSTERGIAVGVAAGIAAICVHSLFVNSIFTTFVMEMMWLTAGLTFVIARRGAREIAQ